MPNGEQFKREWIVYSKNLNAVHCFCCFIFDKNREDKGFTALNGYNDWQHLSEKVKHHEKTQKHLTNYTCWKIVSNEISNQKTVDKELLKQMQAEKERLREVFKRLVAFVIFFARQNIAFTGETSDINDPKDKNGNFQQLVKTVATFDHVLKEHLEQNKTVHYLSPKIQNELIAIIGSKVKLEIVERIKKSKYYSIIVDTTPDVTHSEQMTLVFRYVFFNEETELYEIAESFVGFLKIFDKTGQGISDAILNELNALSLNPDDLRGQAYDNGSNMKGKNIGVQKKIQEKYPRARYNPCASHSLNLLVNDAADATGASINFFSFLNHIYVFFSGSTNRWDILHKHLNKPTNLTPKPLSTTRWSSRIDAVKPLHRNVDKFVDALKEIANSNDFDAKVRHEARSILDKIDYVFLCCVNVWHDILFQINIASQALQSISSNVQTAIKALENLLTYLQCYKESEWMKAVENARETADMIGVEAEFIDDDKRKTSARQYRTSIDSFKTNFLDHIIEVATESANERFDALKDFDQVFSFLYDFSNYDSNKESGKLQESCERLANVLTSNENADIDPNDLFCEFPFVATLVKSQKITNSIDILNVIKQNNVENMVPNMVIAYRIMLSMPVSVASGERSFSKLKIIKNYLRNAMNQDRLNSLAIISIESDIAKCIDYDDIIDEFATQKARKRDLV